MKLLLINLN